MVLLCSFTGKKNNSLNDQYLKGRVKEVTAYIGREENYYFNKFFSLYDEMGNEISRKDFIKNSSMNDTMVMSGRWSYKYNIDGNKTEETIYNLDGSISWRYIYTYGKDACLTEKETYGGEVYRGKTIFKYDANGNNIEKTYFNASSVLDGTCVFKYDERNNLIEKPIGDGEILYKKYDSHGILIEDKIITLEDGDTENDFRDIQYMDTELDSTGNWIKRTEITKYRGDSDTLIYKREITYY